MVATDARPEVADPPPVAARVDRTVRPRRGLPGSRAVVGGLLVTIAAVGVFSATTRSGSAPATRYATAAHRLAPGHRLAPDDVRMVAVALPSPMAGRSFADAEDLIGSVTLGPMEEGELVQAANVAPSRAAGARPELSFAVDADRAVDGSLQAGDRVDILVTYGSGTGSSTELVAPAAQLLAVGGGSSNGLGGARRQVLTVAVDDRAAALPLTNAARAGELTVVRSTGVDGPPGPTTYSPRPLTPATAGAPGPVGPAAGGG